MEITEREKLLLLLSINEQILEVNVKLLKEDDMQKRKQYNDAFIEYESLYRKIKGLK